MALYKIVQALYIIVIYSPVRQDISTILDNRLFCHVLHLLATDQASQILCHTVIWWQIRLFWSLLTICYCKQEKQGCPSQVQWNLYI